MKRANKLKKIIVYGLGRAFEEQKSFIDREFDVVGYSDQKEFSMADYIRPEALLGENYDYIYITSEKYFYEIKAELIKKGIDCNKIISRRNILGDFRNAALRDQWIIEKISSIPEGEILLDAGAGEMLYAKYCSHLKYISQDFGKYNPNDLKEGLQLDKWDTSQVSITCDIAHIPLENQSVDVILCTEVFEHLYNPLLALKEFSRLLKKGGQLILTVPFCSLTHMAPYYYVNGYSKYWYEESMRSFGFVIDEMEKRGNYFKWLAQEMNRLPDMAGRYSDCQIQIEDQLVIEDCLKLLHRLSERDSCSNEVLCFGYMIVAHLA